MNQNPTLKVLFTFQKFGVKSLLIGGQACIVYGAAEFSRDSDLVILCTPENLNKVKKALRALEGRFGKGRSPSPTFCRINPTATNN